MEFEPTAFEAAPTVEPVRYVLLGAPGSKPNLETGEMDISDAGRKRALALVAHRLQLMGGVMLGEGVDLRDHEEIDEYWGNNPDNFQIGILAGRSKLRAGVAEVELEGTEAYGYRKILIDELSVPSSAIVPNPEKPLGEGYAGTTVEEIEKLIRLGFTPIKAYSERNQLRLAVHPYHGARALDVYAKSGLDPEHIELVTPEEQDSRLMEGVAQLAYRLAVIRRKNAIVDPAELVRREERSLLIKALGAVASLASSDKAT
jgi:hypothetical protein